MRSLALASGNDSDSEVPLAVPWARCRLQPEWSAGGPAAGGPPAATGTVLPLALALALAVPQPVPVEV